MKEKLPLVFHLINESDEEKVVKLFDKDEKNIGVHPIIKSLHITYGEVVEQIKHQPIEIDRLMLVTNQGELPVELPIKITTKEEGRSDSFPYWGLTAMSNEAPRLIIYGIVLPEENKVDENTYWEIILPPKLDAYLRVYTFKSKEEIKLETKKEAETAH